MDMDLPRMGEQALLGVSVAALAHVGDAVYELLVRSQLCAEGLLTAKGLHRRTVAQVCAATQARAAHALEPALTPEERDIFRRGRNTELKHIPQAVPPGDYALATALEALFGWLYLQGRRERVSELFALCRAACAGPEKPPSP